MVLNLFGSKTTKGQILKLLSEEWPLTAKQIHNSLQRKYSSTASYQACHKALKELQEEGVLENKDKGYSISFEWIDKIKDSADSLHKTYSEPKGEKAPFVFNTLHEADMFILNFASEHLPKERTDMGWLWSHYWLPLFFTLKEYSKIQEIGKKTESYSVVKGNTNVDKWCAKFWGDSGAHTLYGTDFGSKPDTIAFNGYVIQAHYPKEIMNEMEMTFNKIKKFEDVNPKEIIETLFHKKTRIPLTVTHNQELCKQIIQEAKGYFEGKK